MEKDKKTIEKEKFIKEDGRYIIFYKFNEDAKNNDKNKGKKICQK